MARARLARVAAPAVFLLAVTIAVLLVRSAIAPEEGGTGTTTTAAARPAPPPPPPATTRATTRPASTAGQEFYVIQAGDTLGTVADAYGTTVDELVELNPGIDPTALQVGQRIRVE